MSLQSAIEEQRCLLEELNECGDLEDRLEAAMELDRLENLGFKAVWFNCGLCHGFGHHSEYGESWGCPLCKGKGGKWQ